MWPDSRLAGPLNVTFSCRSLVNHLYFYSRRDQTADCSLLRHYCQDTFSPSDSMIHSRSSEKKKKIIYFQRIYLMMKKKICNNCHTWKAVRAAIIAGLPNPCDNREKFVKCRCMLGSRMWGGRVLQSGDLSWFSMSTSSLVICLQLKNSIKILLPFYFIFDQLILTWWRGEVLFSCRNPGAHSVVGWGIRQLALPEIHSHRCIQNPWQGE